MTGYRAEQPTAEPRYEPPRGSPAIGQVASAVRGSTSLFTVAFLADGAGGYLFALNIWSGPAELGVSGNFTCTSRRRFSAPESELFR